jgi:hypothetical protein
VVAMALTLLPAASARFGSRYLSMSRYANELPFSLTPGFCGLSLVCRSGSCHSCTDRHRRSV